MSRTCVIALHGTLVDCWTLETPSRWRCSLTRLLCSYLGDVIDHVDSVLASLDLFGDLSSNLVDFTFNNLSYSSNSYMQALSVMSVVFLPLTFLS